MARQCYFFQIEFLGKSASTLASVRFCPAVQGIVTGIGCLTLIIVQREKRNIRVLRSVICHVLFLPTGTAHVHRTLLVIAADQKVYF